MCTPLEGKTSVFSTPEGYVHLETLRGMQVLLEAAAPEGIRTSTVTEALLRTEILFELAFEKRWPPQQQAIETLHAELSALTGNEKHPGSKWHDGLTEKSTRQSIFDQADSTLLNTNGDRREELIECLNSKVDEAEKLHTLLGGKLRISLQ